MRSLWPYFIVFVEFNVAWSFVLAPTSTPDAELHTPYCAGNRLLLAPHFQRLVSLPNGENGAHNCANAEHNGRYGLR